MKNMISKSAEGYNLIDSSDYILSILVCVGLRLLTVHKSPIRQLFRILM